VLEFEPLAQPPVELFHGLNTFRIGGPGGAPVVFDQNLQPVVRQVIEIFHFGLPANLFVGISGREAAA
jgi:hypothetical protein